MNDRIERTAISRSPIDLLSVLSTSGDYQGGGIEHHLPGLGWVICEDETECHDQDEYE